MNTISKNTMAMLKIFSKEMDKKVKFEYHNIHFHSDGYAYFPLFQAIIRFKWDSEECFFDFNERDSITINCLEFMNVIGSKGGNYRIGSKDGLAWIEYSGTVKKAITPQDKYVKNIGRLFNKRECDSFKQWESNFMHPLIINKHIPQVLSIWTLETMLKMHTDFNSIKSFHYNPDDSKDIVFASTNDYDCLFVPVGIKGYSGEM